MRGSSSTRSRSDSTPSSVKAAAVSPAASGSASPSRALLHDPDYFIFDEATSALDTISEHLVHEALERVLVDRTSIFIAHRLSTIKDCDRIVVLNNHTIVQDGTFHELRSAPGLFRKMVEHDRF
jgi:ATP-binding cassette, subfamily B, bacterial MsbA